VDWFQAAAAWIAVLVLAILNGALREKGRLKRKPWRDLVVPYTFRDGNLWPLVLVVTLTAPWVAAKMRGFI
jgi:hypothetical protein